METYNQLEMREIFHIEFLRWLSRAIKKENYAVKGGVNLRLFFKSFRYSEDMDLDAKDISVFRLEEAVMKILDNQAFRDILRPFGIVRIEPPDMARAKQTETTQRFKVHLVSYQGEDLFTKVEFSRRGFIGNVVTESVNDAILRAYKLAPVLIPHYDSHSAIAHKIHALANRKAVQARDIFDLYALNPQYAAGGKKINNINPAVISKAYERVFEVEFGQFRDTVLSYLAPRDQALYDSHKSWEEIRIKVANLMEEIRKSYA